MKITWDNIDSFVYDGDKDIFRKRYSPRKSLQWHIETCKECGDIYSISKNEKGSGYCSQKCRFSDPKNNPMYGKHHTEESKKSISENYRKKFGQDNHFYGKHHTQESKDKRMSSMPDQSGKNNPAWKGGITKDKLASYDTYHHRLSPFGVECRRNIDNIDVLEVKCYKCGEWFIPTRGIIKNKIRSINTGMGENNLYCSDKCKESCPVYRFFTSSIDPRSKRYIQRDERIRTRSCQTDHLKQLQCDDVGYNYCERCGDIIDVELHHTIPVGGNGEKAVSSAGHILLCAGCHTHTHKECV